MKFEWDSSKNEANRSKHSVTFEQAITAFDDPFLLITPDPVHSTQHEIREWLIGASDFGMMVVVFTVRQSGKVYRIISARRANRGERRRYEEIKRLSL